ncbi:MAG: tyrosine-type recombinase/integrase [Candidatus Caenarcaniphilales bacterium]|nr:tyrosine-type recombinase/integrase [Candidatus Caenarcaniphilales bacterium]
MKSISIPLSDQITENLIELFLEDRQLKPNSQRAYRTDLRLFREFCLQNAELKFDGVEKWLNGLGARAASRRLTNIRQFLLWLEEKGSFDLDPLWHLPPRKPEYRAQRPEKPALFTAEELSKLLQPIGISLGKSALLALIFDTGATLEELAALRWDNFNLRQKGFLEIGEGNSKRLVYLSKKTIELLKNLRKEKGAADDEAVFRQEREEGAINAGYMALYLRRILKKLLGRELPPTELIEYARRKLIEREGVDEARQILGKKRLYSLFKDQNPPDSSRLRQIHNAVFARSFQG